jgi:hypothetical protein
MALTNQYHLVVDVSGLVHSVLRCAIECTFVGPHGYDYEEYFVVIF